MHPTVREFVECAKKEYQLSVDPVEFSEGTKTATDAAEAIDCDVDQIVKSIAMYISSGELVVALTSGGNRVQEDELADYYEVSNARSANPEEIKEALGWSIGGIPPMCYQAEVDRVIDRKLLEYNTVWAAAGTPQTVFAVNPERLHEMTEATIAEVFG